MNIVSIVCYKTGLYCELDEIDIASPDDIPGTDNFQIIQPDREHFTIVDWKPQQISARLIPNADSCRDTELKLDFQRKAYFLIVTNGTRACNVIGNAAKVMRIATGENTDVSPDDSKNKAAQALGRLGGALGSTHILNPL